jgi:hypothetical protein
MTLKINMVSQFDGCVVGRLQTRILEGEGNSEVASTMRLNINAAVTIKNKPATWNANRKKVEKKREKMNLKKAGGEQARVRVRELVRDTGSNFE